MVECRKCTLYKIFLMFYVVQSVVLINLLSIQEEECFKFTTHFHFDSTVRTVGHSSVTKY